jgi:acyl-CoA reductase-like NAD-dependent aldehyde dehydrogenase
MRDAGVPSGVLNLITGPGAQLAQEITRNEDVAGVVFTGSLKSIVS